MCEAGVNLKAIQDILGHSDVETTLDIYTDVTGDFKRKEMENFDQFYSAMKSPRPQSDRRLRLVKGAENDLKPRSIMA